MKILGIRRKPEKWDGSRTPGDGNDKRESQENNCQMYTLLYFNYNVKKSFAQYCVEICFGKMIHIKLLYRYNTFFVWF